MSFLASRRPAASRIAFFLAFALTTAGSLRAPAASLPVVIVYPLTTTGDLGEADAGGRFATVMASRIAQGGGVTVEPFTPGTARADYLTAARAAGADYYVTGFLTPIGREVTVVSQVVSVDSGTVMWSQSAFVKTFGDADAQAEAVRHAIIARAGRYLAEIDAPTAAPDATARPSKSSETGISFLGGRHRRHAAPATPQPAAAASVSAVAVASAAPTARGRSAAPAPVVVVARPAADGTAGVRPRRRLRHASIELGAARRRLDAREPLRSDRHRARIDRRRGRRFGA